MFGLNIKRWKLSEVMKSSFNRTGQVSPQKMYVRFEEVKNCLEHFLVQLELKKLRHLDGAAFFSKFMGLFCCDGNRIVNGSRVCADFLPRESVRNARVSFN